MKKTSRSMDYENHKQLALPLNLSFKDLPLWFKESKTEGAHVTYREDGDEEKSFVWHDGIWLNGIWQGNVWVNGIWENGIWKRGEWLAGSWLDGTWENGSWASGQWHNGVWLNGHWNLGQWLGGIWIEGKCKGKDCFGWNPDGKPITI
jgi:hypothetical protein